MSTRAIQQPSLVPRAGVYVTGRRVVATILDGLVFGFVYNTLVAVFGEITHPSPWYWQGTMPNVLANVAYGIGVVAYFILMEGYFGQTLGKMAAGIMVVREDTGDVSGLGPAAIRTALRIVDSLFGYLIAFIVVLSNDKRQRLGDMVAHTLVVLK